jgi:hypothetical protein
MCATGGVRHVAGLLGQVKQLLALPQRRGAKIDVRGCGGSGWGVPVEYCTAKWCGKITRGCSITGLSSVQHVSEHYSSSTLPGDRGLSGCLRSKA